MNIQTFSFANQSLQIIIKDNQAWFIAREVANLLGYRDAHNLTRLLDDDEKDTHNMSTPSGNQDVSIINESGFYHAAFKSRKPEVKPFRKWVTSEVLPQIRKTGTYSGSPKPTKDERTGLRQAVTALVGKFDINHSTAYKLVHHRFGVASIEDLTHEQIPQAIEYVHRLILDGEVLDKIPPTPFNQTEFACHFVKLLNYARCYLRFQKLLCNDPNSPKAQELLNFFQYSVNVNQTGFLFVFKPDVENDIQKAADFIHHHFQQHDLQVI